MTPEAPNARPSKDIHLLRMGLVRSRFESIPLVLEPSNLEQAAQQLAPGGSPEMNLAINISHERGQEEGQIGVHLEVDMTLKLGSAVIVSAHCEYVAFYIRGADAEVTEEGLITIHAPSHLYAFAREHLADLTRRAGGQVVLPPTHFAIPNRKPSGETGDSAKSSSD